MKILLTGANGFVGSHILDSLQSHGLNTAILLRPSAHKSFVEHNIPWAEVHLGSLADPDSLAPALQGVTHVIHCAGATKARRAADFFTTNQLATRRLMEALAKTRIQRLVHISSLAAAGPSLPTQPRKETDPPEPVSEYGKSKLAGELEVKNLCRCEYVILRPPAVYGPRDIEFLKLFRAVRRHVLPCSNQLLSLVYVKDLARVAVDCLTAPKAAGQIFFVAHPEALTIRDMGRQVASLMKSWVLRLPMPLPLLWGLCVVAEAGCRVTGKPGVLNLQKLAELRAPGWWCDPGLLRSELGLACATPFREGAAQTVAWYRECGWL